MLVKKIILLFFSLFFLQVSFAGVELERSVQEFKLPNGMKWLLLKKDFAPVFFGIIQVKVGSIEEENGKTGLAHFLEHMAFKGTPDISGPELWDAFISSGARGLNAATNKDMTAYFANMPSSKLELWLYLNSEMIKHSVLREFFKERDVVLEERRSSVENNPKGKMFNVLLSTAFKKSPYSWPTIGNAQDVSNLQPEDMEKFKKKYYTPDRMVGAIVGDINIEHAKSLIARYFGGIKRVKSMPENFPKEEPQTKERRAQVKFNASKSVIIAYHKPTLPHYDDYAFDIITYILCMGESSRLKKSLVEDKKIASSVGCDSSAPGARLDNLFIIIADPIKGHSIKEVEEAIKNELENLKKTPPSEEEMQKAKNNLVAEFIFQLATNEGLGENLAYFETVAHDWRYMTKHAEKISKITADEISNIAKRYFIDNNKTVVELK